jgi:hypothetical protein
MWRGVIMIIDEDLQEAVDKAKEYINGNPFALDIDEKQRVAFVLYVKMLEELSVCKDIHFWDIKNKYQNKMRRVLAGVADED